MGPHPTPSWTSSSCLKTQFILKANGSRVCKYVYVGYVGCNEQDARAFIKGRAEADNRLVEIIRKKLRAKQLPRASDRPHTMASTWLIRGSQVQTNMS